MFSFWIRPWNMLSSAGFKNSIELLESSAHSLAYKPISILDLWATERKLTKTTK